jgi:hypothetical protein
VWINSTSGVIVPLDFCKHDWTSKQISIICAITDC